MVRLIKVLTIVCMFLGALTFSLIKPYDSRPYSDTPFYQDMLDQVDGIEPLTRDKSALVAGWAKGAILPPDPVPIASYGIRNNYENIHDTIYAKVFAFSDGFSDATIISLDLLIFPPALYQYLEDSLGENAMKSLFFSATHTHNGPGGWLRGPAARFIAGDFNQKYLYSLGDTVIRLIREARSKLKPARIRYHELPHPENIANRLVGTDPTDSLIRYITIMNSLKEKAIIVSYGAHANCISHKINDISADYPGALCQELEQNGYNMAAFISGAVGSMTNNCHNLENYDCTRLIGQAIATKILNASSEPSFTDSLNIQTGKIDLLLKDSAPRVSKDWTLRPWIFKTLLGSQPLFISYLKLGNISLIGTPCDFSGVLSNEIHEQHPDKDYIISSFNGSYAGYITPVHYDHLEKSETREMNWLGYDNGTYFKTIINHLLAKLYSEKRL